MPMIDTKEYFTCAEAAKALELSPDSVRKYCHNIKEGRTPFLEAIQVGRDWLIHKTEIARYKRDRVGRGRPASV